jgi:hypothetical protein
LVTDVRFSSQDRPHLRSKTCRCSDQSTETGFIKRPSDGSMSLVRNAIKASTCSGASNVSLRIRLTKDGLIRSALAMSCMVVWTPVSISRHPRNSPETPASGAPAWGYRSRQPSKKSVFVRAGKHRFIQAVSHYHRYRRRRPSCHSRRVRRAVLIPALF